MNHLKHAHEEEHLKDRNLRKVKIMMKCTVQNTSKNGPKTTLVGQKVP
jgi:hypothetical protein